MRVIQVVQNHEKELKVRLDKWLWVARFYKTRALAKAAIENGKVHHRGKRCKPGKETRLGDEFQVRIGFDDRTIVVQLLSVVRRGTPEAQAMYAETDDSITKRHTAASMRNAGMTTGGKPSKRQRRDAIKFRITGSDA